MATFYVSTSGSDSNPGTIGSPFLTLAKAESVVVAGDLVLIDDGSYAGITTTKNGTNNSTRITFQAINTGNVSLTTPIVSPNNFRTYDGLAFNNVSDRAFDVTGGNNNFFNLFITINYGTGYGIKIGMDANTGGSTASNNVIDNLRIVSTFVGAQTVHGVLFGGGANGNICRNSYFSGTYYGIVDKVCANTRIYNNVFNFNASGLYTCIYAKGATNGIYIHNVLRQTGSNCFGILMAPSDGGTPQATGQQILNNIFIKGTDASIYNAGTGTFISNYNLFQYSTGTLVLDPAGYSTLANWQTTGHDLNSIAGTPTFTNGSATLTELDDYMPTSSSPVINNGIATFRTTDAGGNGVVSVPDIGPWEYLATGNTYWIATDGDDSNTGLSISDPWLHIEKINGINLLPGDTVNIRAGTYDSYAPLFATTTNNVLINNKSGTSSAHITVQGYPPDFVGGGYVVYNCLNVARTSGGIGIHTLDCSYIDFWRISVVGPAQEVGGGSGTYAACWWIDANTAKTNVTCNICEASFSMTGFRLDNVNNHTLNNCDSHDLDDPFTGAPTGPHNNSDGFSRTGHGNTATNTVYNYCRAWNCADDGWDCIRTIGSIYYNGCWSFHNGFNAGGDSLGDGNGFKMGGTVSTDGSENASTTVVTRFVTRCLAAGNKANGFDQNNGVFLAQLYNNSSINNGLSDFKFAYYPERQIHHIFKNNASYGSSIIAGPIPSESQYWVQANNSWNGAVTIDAGDFIALSPLTELQGARNADGSLPLVSFAHLIDGSDLIDAGTLDVGLPFNGLAPDMGAFETGDPLPPPGDPPPPPVPGTITGLSIAFTLCDPAPEDGFEIQYRVFGDPDWISAGLFTDTPAVITGLSYPTGTVFEARSLNSDCICTPVTDPPDVTLPEAVIGVPYDFTIDLPGTPTPPVTFTAIDVPSWLTIEIVDNMDGTFSIHFTGDPEAGTDVPVHFTVQNDCATIDIDTTISTLELGIYTITQTATTGSEQVRQIQVFSNDGTPCPCVIDWGDGTFESFTLGAFSSTVLFHVYAASETSYTSIIYFENNVALFTYNDVIVGEDYHTTTFWDKSVNFTAAQFGLTLTGVDDIATCLPPNPSANITNISYGARTDPGFESTMTSIDFSGLDANVGFLSLGDFVNLTTITGIPSTMNSVFACQNCTALTTIQGVGGNLPALQNLTITNTGQDFTYDTINFSAMTSLNMYNNALTVSKVNALLVGLDGNGLLNGSVSLQGQTPAATPTGAGATAAANLVSKGWTVTTD